MSTINISFTFLLVCLLYSNQVLKGQNNKFAEIKSLDKIVNHAVQNVSSFIDCYEDEDNFKRCFLVYLHNTSKNKSLVFSVDDFPFDNRAIEQLSLLGYHYSNGNLIFIAVDKGSEFKYPDLDTTLLPNVVDSVVNRYHNIIGQGGVMVHYYYYLFKFNSNIMSKRKLKLEYQFYPSFSKVPLAYQGSEVLSISNNPNIQYMDIKGFTIFNHCQNYNYLSNNQKETLKSGYIKVKF